MDKVVDFLLVLLQRMPLWLQAIIFLVVGIGFALSFLRVVNEAEQGVVLRFGKVRRYRFGKRKGQPKIVLPGFIIVIPKIDQLVKHHTREQPLDLDPQEVILQDGSIFRVKAVAFFRIFDIYKALFDVAHLEVAIKNLCGGELREVLQGLAGVAEIKDVKGVTGQVLAACKEPVANWGSNLVRFKLVDVTPSQETSAAVTAPTLVKARMNALKEAGLTDNPMLATAILGAPTVAAVSSPAAAAA